MMFRSRKKVIPKRVQDIVDPGFLRTQGEKQTLLRFGQCIALFMVVVFILLPAFPALAQFEQAEGVGDIEGSVAVGDGEQLPPVEALPIAVTDAMSQIATDTAPIVVSSTISIDSIHDEEIETVSSSTPVEIKTDSSLLPLQGGEGTNSSVSSSTPLATVLAATPPGHSVGGSVGMDINALRDQIRREVENDFRAKMVTGEEQEKIKDEITERIRQGCLEFEDGSYYCIKSNVRAMPTSSESLAEVPVVFLGKSENGGNRGVFLKENGGVRQISHGVEDTLFPALDLYGNSIVWQALFNDTWQITMYDRTTASTTALTYTNFNNMNPQIQRDVIVWQGWVDNNWDIFIAQKGMVSVPSTSSLTSSTVSSQKSMDGILAPNVAWNTRRLTQNTWHDMFPRISDGRVTWQAYKDGVWQIFMYDIETGVISQLSEGNEKSENPRFVVLWEKRNAEGEVQTYGYDMTSGESLMIGKHEDKMPFSKEVPQAPLQENKGVIPVVSSTAKVENQNENSSD